MKTIISYKILFLLLFYSPLVFAQRSMETVMQKGHSLSVKSIAVSPDGKFVVTGSRDRTIKLWNLDSKAEMRTFSGHSGTVNSLSWSPNGKFIASTSVDQTARVWEVASGKMVFVSPNASKVLTSIAFSADGKHIAFGGYPDSVLIYDWASAKKITGIPVSGDQGSGYGVSISYSTDGRWLAIGEDNRAAHVYNAKTYTPVFSFKTEEGWCGGCGTLLTISADGERLFKISLHDSISVFDLNTGKKTASFGKPVESMQSISFSSANHSLMVAYNHTIEWWNVDKKTLLKTFKTDSLDGENNEIVVSPDGKHCLAACDQSIAGIYSTEDGKNQGKLTGLYTKIDKGGLTYSADNYRERYIARYIRLKNQLMLTLDDQFFITGKTGTSAVIWNISDGSPKTYFSNHEKAVLCFDLSKDGKKLITGDGAGNATIWDFTTGKKIQQLKAHREPIFDIHFSPDNSTFATSSWDGYLNIWNTTTGKAETWMDMNNQSAFCFNYTPDGLYLAVGKLDKSLEIYEPDSKEVVRKCIGHTDVVSSIQFGMDKNRMLTASWDGSARLWDISTGLMVQKFKGGEGAMHTAIFSPDNRKIITAGEDRIIRIWDVVTAKVVQELKGHQTEITSIKITQDAKMLVSYSLDGAIKCWNLERGTEFYEHLHFSENDWMARTREGYFNATSGARDAVHFVRDMEVYATDQFFDSFYKPDLIPQLFKNRGGVENKMMNMNQMLQQAPLPSVKLYVEMVEEGRSGLLHIKLTNRGGGIHDLKIVQNGKTLPFQSKDVVFPTVKDSSIIVTYKTSLVYGENTFAVAASNKNLVYSPTAESIVVATNVSPQVTCHVMAIGINNYKNPALKLTYAREDAEALVQLVKTKGVLLYSRLSIHTLYDDMATKDRILDTLQRISERAGNEDVFIFYYAGHGSMNDGKFYFIPSDCIRLFDPEEIEKKAISDNEMQEKLKSIQALKQIIIMDACQSGGSVEKLATRGAQEEKALAQLSRSAGIHVMASAGGEQNAKEITELKHGLFTYVLLDALSGKADGSPKDGKVTIYELKSYLDDQVPELNSQYKGKLQFPYTFSKGQDFPIVKD